MIWIFSLVQDYKIKSLHRRLLRPRNYLGFSPTRFGRSRSTFWVWGLSLTRLGRTWSIFGFEVWVLQQVLAVPFAQCTCNASANKPISNANTDTNKHQPTTSNTNKQHPISSNTKTDSPTNLNQPKQTTQRLVSSCREFLFCLFLQ